MLHDMPAAPPTILTPDDGPVAEVINPGGAGPVVLVCEHASAFIPSGLNELGLAPEDRLSHAAWDPGALDLARALSSLMDAPLVAGRVSRLVHDCNRPPEAHDAMPERVERIDIPGNRNLTEGERAARAAAVYVPFHASVGAVLTARPDAALVTIHSFTPFWHGTARETEIGLLHDADADLARRMAAAANGPHRVALNEPYSAADGVTHTLARHASPRGRANVMVEVRNDLLPDVDAAERMAAELAAMLTAALAEGVDRR